LINQHPPIHQPWQTAPRLAWHSGLEDPASFLKLQQCPHLIFHLFQMTVEISIDIAAIKNRIIVYPDQPDNLTQG
jgi:hypothetical protein